VGGFVEGYVLAASRRVEVSAVLGIFYILRRIERRASFVLCHEHMNRDWESQLNCLYYDDTKLKKEEGS
jgi:hypothetical protein